MQDITISKWDFGLESTHMDIDSPRLIRLDRSAGHKLAQEASSKQHKFSAIDQAGKQKTSKQHCVITLLGEMKGRIHTPARGLMMNAAQLPFSTTKGDSAQMTSELWKVLMTALVFIHMRSFENKLQQPWDLGPVKLWKCCIWRLEPSEKVHEAVSNEERHSNFEPNMYSTILTLVGCRLSLAVVVFRKGPSITIQ